ncbi:MAG: flavin monoamine oxidase family protein [Candidatus Acidiferrales bacterium]
MAKSVNPKSCIVIGAGLSGLAAAYELTKHKWKVTVLEAQDFTNGRVYSFRFKKAPGLVCELGGEWIGDGHEAMLALCDELGLETMRHRFDFFFVNKGKPEKKKYKAGKSPFTKRSRDAYNKLNEASKHWIPAQREILDRKDWWTILRDAGFVESELQRRDLMDSTDFGETIRQSGGYSAAAEYFESNASDEMDKKIVGGNEELPKALKKKIVAGGGKILISRRVWKIDQTDPLKSVIVHTTGRRTPFHAKYCICTVPARALTKIKFRPGLPDEQWDSAKQLQYARIMKTAILCDTRFWKKKYKRFSCFTDTTSDFLFDATMGQLEPIGPDGKRDKRGILCSYAIGDKADDLAAYSKRHLMERLQQNIGDIFPGVKFRILDIKRQPWQANKYTQGAYGFYRPGQWFTVREILARPFGRVYFAGEHIADDQGFMEGAVDTGRAAAQAIL